MNKIEKAKELINKFYPKCTSYSADRKNQKENAKECALIATKEILSLMIKFHNRHISDNSKEIIFWQEVEQEIINYDIRQI